MKFTAEKLDLAGRRAGLAETGAEPKPVELTEQQTASFNTLIDFAIGGGDFGMALLEGYAGTGKTTLVGALVGAVAGGDRADLDDFDDFTLSSGSFRIAIAAPTNKAVRVLKEKIEAQTGLALNETRQWSGADGGPKRPMRFPLEFGSIHSFLGLKIKEMDDGSQECRPEKDSNLHEFDLVIIDECSMLGADLLDRVSASRRTARVLFVGDPAQLPPVTSSARGKVSPVFERVTLRTTLTDVVRQAADNPIIRLSIAIRKAMEGNAKMTSVAMQENLPKKLPAKAALVGGGFDRARRIALHEIGAGRDARILAFTNDQVQNYNRAIHSDLHGATPFAFVVGERVIAHSAFDATMVNDLKETKVITSEELTVTKIGPGRHPSYPEIDAVEVEAENDLEHLIRMFYPIDPGAVDREVGRLFGEWRRLNAEAKADKRAGGDEYPQMELDARYNSSKAWKLRKAFAPLRHAYALTAHKSQGSTFDTAIVDLGNLSKMRSAFDFNRALYVSATRASEHLAIIGS